LLLRSHLNERGITDAPETYERRMTRTIERGDPFSAMMTLHDAMNRLFEERVVWPSRATTQAPGRSGEQPKQIADQAREVGQQP
jgi:hypothetical protein